MDVTSRLSESDSSLAPLLEIVGDIAADAAGQADPDTCLRRLRSGLIRLGFGRAGTGIAIVDDPRTWHGTWGTSWDGAELDEHRSVWDVQSLNGFQEVLDGARISLHRVELPSDLSATVQPVASTTPGPPNQATVALRADGRLLGAISVDMLPGDGVIDRDHVAALELLADVVAIAIARAQVVDELRDSESRYRILSELASDYNWVTRVKEDGTGVLEWGSESLFRVTGYSIDELRDTRMLLMKTHPDDRARVVTSYQKVIAGSPDAVEFRIITRTGEQRWLRLSRRAIWNDQEHRVVRIIAAAQDITDRVRSDEQLRQVQKMEAVGQLAGGVAHDFNNLLTVINGYGEILAREVPTGTPLGGIIEQILQAGQSAASLTSQLLAFSRRQIIAPRELDLNEVINRVGIMLRRIIGDDITLHTHLAPRLGRVIADPGQVEQILLNLAANARDALPRGGEITIETVNLEIPAFSPDPPDLSPGSYVTLSVSDNGTGMDEATRSHIFEPFFTTKPLGQGTGLGLAVVHSIVTQNNGSVAVVSAPGLGTTFRISFPRIKTVSQPVRPASAVAEPPIGSETILLVEDSSQLRRLARMMLESLGYSVVEADSGPRALELVENDDCHPDLLLSDVVMPTMSGRELVEILVPRQPRLKVLLMSGYTADVVLRHGVDEEAYSFLPKPFTRLGLAQKVRATLDGN